MYLDPTFFTVVGVCVTASAVMKGIEKIDTPKKREKKTTPRFEYEKQLSVREAYKELVRAAVRAGSV